MDLEFECVECGAPFHVGIDAEAPADLETKEHITRADCEGATMNCPHCGFLHLVQRGKAVSFHAEMHARHGDRWPADGAGTAYVEIEAPPMPIGACASCSGCSECLGSSGRN